MENNVGTIYLTTFSACVIWKHEIVGQLSDGLWENTRPYDHWRFWCALDVKHDHSKLGVDTSKLWMCRKTRYNIAALYEYVGERMVKLGRLAAAAASIGLGLSSFDYELRIAAEKMPPTMEEFNALADDRLHKAVNQELAAEYYRTTYTMKDLRHDVKLIKLAMRTGTE